MCPAPLRAQTYSKAILPRRASIILILADDIGYGVLGCYGQANIAAVAMARTGGSRNPAPPSSTNSGQQLLPDAPVGHRQPRADQVPSEKNLMDPNDPVNKENAALDRMINGICRGC